MTGYEVNWIETYIHIHLPWEWIRKSFAPGGEHISHPLFLDGIFFSSVVEKLRNCHQGNQVCLDEIRAVNLRGAAQRSNITASNTDLTRKMQGFLYMLLARHNPNPYPSVALFHTEGKATVERGYNSPHIASRHIRTELHRCRQVDPWNHEETQKTAIWTYARSPARPPAAFDFSPSFYSSWRIIALSQQASTMV